MDVDVHLGGINAPGWYSQRALSATQGVLLPEIIDDSGSSTEVEDEGEEPRESTAQVATAPSRLPWSWLLNRRAEAGPQRSNLALRRRQMAR